MAETTNEDFEMVNLIERDTKLTNAEFAALERNEEGRILWDFDLAWIWATDSQRLRMHGDDQSQGFELDEEMTFLISEFM